MKVYLVVVFLLAALLFAGLITTCLIVCCCDTKNIKENWFSSVDVTKMTKS